MLLSLSQSELRVLGFLVAICGLLYEVLTQERERLGYLGFYAALMGVSSLWKSGTPDRE